MLIDYQLGQTSIILRVKIRQDTTGGSPGKGMTGLTNTSSGLIISTIADNEASATAYTSAGSTIDTITTLGTYATPTAGHCEFKQVDSTNHPGVYEIQLANARFNVSSAKSLLVSIVGVSGMMDCDVVVPLRSVNPYSANNFMTGTNGVTHTYDTNNYLKVDAEDIQGATISTTTAQIGVNAVQINAVSTTNVTTINANVGTTQPLNFTGTAGSALVKADAVDIGGTAAASATVGTVTNVTNGVTVGGYASGQDPQVRKNQALNNFEFLMISSSDHVTPKTGLGTGITCQRSLDGAAFGSCANTASELSNGIYVINLAAGDLNANVVTLRFSDTGADDTFICLITQP